MKSFWKHKSLEQLNDQEWEQLCDGCGRCCLQKLECADTGEIFYTELACRLLDLQDCSCTDYANRTQVVESCLDLRELKANDWQFMPSSCAYRLLYEGKPLFDWHPLIAGNHLLMETAGIFVKGRVLHDIDVEEDDFEEHLVTWVHC